MAVSYADNAVMAKAHAMYGKRLTKENYNDMLNCKSLVELANYLKQEHIIARILTPCRLISTRRRSKKFSR